MSPSHHMFQNKVNLEQFATNESANLHPESWFIEKLKICTETKAR